MNNPKKNEAEALAKEPKEKIETPEIDDLLTKGFNTTYGGIFLLLPYLLVLGIDKIVITLGIKKQDGTTVFQSVLTLIFLALIGKKRVSKAETCKDYGIATIAGFSKIPSKSYLHEFLDNITVSCAEKFQIVSAKAFSKLGIFKGKIINLDGHFTAYFGKSKIGKEYPLQNDWYIL